MSAAPDEADRLRAGTLPSNPLAGTERMAPTRADATSDGASDRALLGALLWAGAFAPTALRAEMVQDLVAGGEAFAEARHQATFRACLACHAKDAEHDPVAVHAAMAEAGQPWGLEKLRELQDGASTVSEAQARVYAHRVRESWARRRICAAASELSARARDPKAKPAETIVEARAQIDALGADLAASGHYLTAKDAVAQYFERLRSQENAHWSTGFRDLDASIVGLFPREVSLIAARTSVGKSALATGISEHIATASGGQAVVLYVSLEMHASLFCGRLAASRAGIPAKMLRRKTLTQEQWSKLATAVRDIAALGLIFNDAMSQTIASIAAMGDELVRKLAREGKTLALIVIDHLGLVQPTSESLKKDNRERQVAEVSRHLRQLANRFGCHVTALVQINRAAEDQKGKVKSRVPKLWHLAESDAAARDADVVMIVHRDRDEVTGVLDSTKPAGLVVAKARNDEQAATLLRFDAQTVSFSDYDGDETFQRVYGGPNA